MARLFLIDGSNHAFRVQFALPPRHASNGFPTRVLYGFTLLFQKMMRTWKPDYVVVSFDTKGNFREQLYADYKGHRPPMPEDLAQQWPLLPQIVEGFGYKCISLDGFEADDVLGTLAMQFAGEDLEVMIVTGDKDFCQLVGPHVSLLDESKSLVIDPAGVVEKFGVPPERVIDVLALAGDASDNVPGVTKVGMKTAAKLVIDFGSVDDVIAAAQRGDVKGKTGERLVEEADMARLSKQLVTIALDAPVGVTLDDLRPRPMDEATLRELFDAWEFGLVARKLLPDQETVSSGEATVASDPTAIADVVARVRKGELDSFELLTDDDPISPDPLGIAWGGPSTVPVWVPFDDLMGRASMFNLLADPSVPKITDGARRAYKSLASHGKGLKGLVGDARLLDYVLAPHVRAHGLESQASRHLGHTLGQGRPTLEGADPRAPATVEAASLIARLHARNFAKLEAGQVHVYRDIELPLTPILAEMEVTGIRLDVAQIADVDASIAARLEEVHKECIALAGKEFNLASRHELRDVLFVDLKLPGSKKVKDGWSTESSVLEGLVELHPLPERVLEWRSLDKLRGTYLTKLPEYVARDGRIHTTFAQDVAATGRLSSTDPNLQNIPGRTPEGRRIRACFVPADGHVFLSADYSQIEIRILAHVTEDPVLLAGFLAGEDIHRRTAIEIFRADPDKVTIAQRSAAKAINFGLIYGMSAFRLARDLGIERGEAQKIMDGYFARMPSVQAWIEATKASTRTHGYVETLYGRRRLIPEIHSKMFQERTAAEREAVNTPIQGTAADLIKMAMLKVHAALAATGSRAKIVLQVHDELLLEVPRSEIDAVRPLVADAMRHVADLRVPLEVTTSVGDNWDQAHG